jgi:beta-lactamase regulating signal transducer with metallopeptidase domain
MLPAVSAPSVARIEPLAKPFSAPAIVPVTIRLAAEPSPHAAPPMRLQQALRSALPAPAALPAIRLDLGSVLLALWAAGFLLLAFRWITRWSRVRALLREAVDVPAAAPVAVKFSMSRLEPGLVGILHPVILLPEGIERQLSPEEFKAVLAHELCHWRRRDNLLAAIHMLVEALFWFFPLVWWLGARLNAERERACDESVLAEGNDPQLYAGGILKVCRAYLQSPLACVAGVSGADLKKRIDAIMENRLVLRLNAARKFLLSASAAAALALPLALGLLAIPVVQLQAKAAQILSPVKPAQKGSEQTPPPVPETSMAALPASQAAEIPVASPLQTQKPAIPGTDALSAAAPQSLSDAAPTPEAPPTSNDPVLAQLQPNSALAAAQAAGAQIGVPACDPPKLVNSLPMEQVPGSNLMTVTAIIDGSPEKMLFDIGRMSSQLWNTTAAKFHLAVQQGARGWDFAGRYSEDSARVADFAIGSMQTGGFHIRVSPDPDAVPAPFAGIIRNDMMWRYDIDLDFAHQRLNYFSPEQCKGAGIYWSPTTITSVPIVAYTGLEYDDRSPIPRLGTTYVPVTLDGHEIIALLDTSADRTFLNPDVAKRLFGLTLDSAQGGPDSAEAGDVTDGGTRIKAGLHRFSSLSFGGLTASNPQIAIPFDIKSQSSGISHISKTAQNSFYLHELIPDLVIGMDVLKHAHLYVAFGSARVYVSAAGEGPALKPEPIASSWFNVYGRPQY